MPASSVSNNDEQSSPPSWREHREKHKKLRSPGVISYDGDQEGKNRQNKKPKEPILTDEHYEVFFKSGTDKIEKERLISQMESQLGAEFKLKVQRRVDAPLLADGQPRLWVDREGRPEDKKLSSIEWIKKYYCHLVGEADADKARSNRERLAKADPELARAYVSTIRSTPSQTLPGLPLLPRSPAQDPQEALDKLKSQQREASARYRAAKRII